VAAAVRCRADMRESQEKKNSGLAWKLAFALFLSILILDFADQSMLGPLLNSLLQDFFQNTRDVVPIGWVSFFFTFFSAISMITAGIMADRSSRKKICFFGSFIYSLSSVLVILVPHGPSGYFFFLLNRALNGIGIGAIVPAIFSMVGDGVSPKRRTTAFAYISLAMMTGRMAGFIIAGSSLNRWRSAYFILGVINFLLAMGLLAIREPRRAVQEDELRHLILEGAEYRFRISKQDFKFIRSNRSNLWLVMNFVDVIPGSIIVFLIFKYLRDIHNLGAGMINATIILVALMGGAGTIFFGRLGDRWFQRDKRAKAKIALFCNGFPIIFMLGFLLLNFRIHDSASLADAFAMPVFWMLMLFIGLAMFVNQGVNPNWYSMLTDINLPEHRGTLISLAALMDIVGNAIGPLIASYLATAWGIKTAMWSVLIFWVINIFLWLPVLAFIKGDLMKIHRCLIRRADVLKNQIR
jgi:MFS family permease